LAKKKAIKPKHEATKRQLSLWQRQKKRQRIILILGISVIGTVAGVLGSGWYTNEYQPLHQPAIKVNDTEFDMGYYVQMFEIVGGNQPDFVQFLTDTVVRLIEENELIKQGAEDLGITASNSEIDEVLNSSALPLNRSYRDLVGTEILKGKLLNEHFDQQVPIFADQRQVMAMFLESENQVAEIRVRLENGEEFGQLASELSLEALSQANGGDFGWHIRDILTEQLATSIIDDFAFTSEAGVLSQPIYDKVRNKSVGYWVVEVLERDDEFKEVQIQAMLLGNEQEAQEVIAKLENGDDFATLAEEFSQHQESKADGGDLGWLTYAQIDIGFKDFALNSEAGTLSEPIKDEEIATKGGYWLIKVVDKDENREIEISDRDSLKSKALEEWISSLWDNPANEVENYLDDEKRAWAIERVMKTIATPTGTR